MRCASIECMVFLISRKLEVTRETFRHKANFRVMTVHKDLNIGFVDLVVHCKEAELLSGGTFFDRVCKQIDADLYEQAQKVRKLYNPYRNLYLDQCYGESKRPLGEWMGFSKYKE